MVCFFRRIAPSLPGSPGHHTFAESRCITISYPSVRTLFQHPQELLERKSWTYHWGLIQLYFDRVLVMAVSKSTLDNASSETSPLLSKTKSITTQTEGYSSGESSDCEVGTLRETPSSEERTYSQSFIAKVVIALFIGKSRSETWHSWTSWSETL